MKFHLSIDIRPIISTIAAGLAIMVIWFLFQLDGVVNVVMYGHGLQFNLDWATPYWFFMRFSLGLLALISGINFFLTVYSFLSHKTVVYQKRERTVIAQPLKSAMAQPAKPQETVTNVASAEKTRKDQGDGVEIAGIPLMCNKCGKVFTQPLSMLDFKSGKPRLVNVCPYCNAILTVSGNLRTE